MQLPDHFEGKRSRADLAGLGAPLQRRGTGRALNLKSQGPGSKLTARQQAEIGRTCRGRLQPPRSIGSCVGGSICATNCSGASVSRFTSVRLGMFVATGSHAALVLDGAGLVRLPPCAPELNPIENVWSICAATNSRPPIFGDDIVDKTCDAWNFLSKIQCASRQPNPNMDNGQ
jgi:hypothetical protein